MSLTLGLALAACADEAPADVGESSEDIQTATAIKPVDLLSCWVVPDTKNTDPFFQAHELRCTRPALGDYPLVPDRAIVEARTARDNVLFAYVKDTEVSLGRFYNDAFPITLSTRIIFGQSTTAGNSFAIKEQRTIASLAEATKDKPAVYKSPFTLWGIAVRAADPARQLFVSSSYQAPTPGYTVGFNFHIPDTDVAELNVRAQQRSVDGVAEMALIAPPKDDIELSINGNKVKVAGPGSYIFDGTTLTRDSARPPTPTQDDVEPPKNPTCGTASLPLCEDGSCAIGHRNDGGKCLPCGDEGQTWCGASYSNATCNVGHRLDGAVCRVCGNDGQTWCGNSYNNASCNVGHRLDGAVCRVCGDDGQTWCGTSYNNATCNAGHRLDASVCRVCGDDGQTWCGTSYNNATCNVGHRLDGAICRVCGGEGQTWCGTSFNNATCNAGLRLVGNICSK